MWELINAYGRWALSMRRDPDLAADRIKEPLNEESKHHIGD